MAEITTDQQVTDTSTPPEDYIEPEVSLWRIRLALAWSGLKRNAHLFAQNRVGLIGLAIIIFYALLAAMYPVFRATIWDVTDPLSRTNVYDPVVGYDSNYIEHPAAPSATHWLGTDPLGRDVLAQLMSSTASEFLLGVTAALVTVAIATTVGAISAYMGGPVDMFFMRLADIVIMMPFITILIVLSALFDLQMFHLAMMIGILGGFGGTAVVIKSQALTIKVKPYIEAAKIAGGSHAHIIFRHIIPNLLPLSFLYMMFSVTSAIFAEAVLSFFGLLNLRMSWGLMIHTTEFAGYMLRIEKWWLIFPASLSITLLSAAFYLVGRALDEVVNPRLRRR